MRMWSLSIYACYQSCLVCTNASFQRMESHACSFGDRKIVLCSITLFYFPAKSLLVYTQLWYQQLAQCRFGHFLEAGRTFRNALLKTVVTYAEIMFLILQALSVSLLFIFLSWVALRSKKSAISDITTRSPGRFHIGHVRIVPTHAYIDSDVIYVNMMGQPIVGLHSVEASLDLMERRGNIYCERPNLNFFDE